MHTPPEWISELANLLASRMDLMDPLTPLGCHYHCSDGVWEITLFASRTEVFGGAFDGGSFTSCFQMDLMEIASLLDEVEQIYWQPVRIAKEDDLGSHIGIVGTYQGEQVWLRVTAQQPDRFEAGLVADIFSMQFEERW